MEFCRVQANAPGRAKLSWFPGSCLRLAWALVPGTTPGPSISGSRQAGMTWCPGNHQPCPAPPPPLIHPHPGGRLLWSHQTLWSRNKGGVEVEEQSLGHPRVTESARHLPGRGASSRLPPLPGLPWHGTGGHPSGARSAALGP